jgi:hypothetical protein
MGKSGQRNPERIEHDRHHHRTNAVHPRDIDKIRHEPDQRGEQENKTAKRPGQQQAYRNHKHNHDTVEPPPLNPRKEVR